jgi:hypothetical protein
MKKTVLCAAAALMALSTGTAFAEGGGGGNGGADLYGERTAGTPPGFFAGIPGYNGQQSMQAYVIRRQNARLAARQDNHTPAAQAKLDIRQRTDPERTTR